MVVVPANSALTIPVLPIVATLVLVLLHVPPDAVLVSVIFLPMHTIEEPDITPTVGEVAILIL
jgi:hypothetical protein